MIRMFLKSRRCIWEFKHLVGLHFCVFLKAPKLKFPGWLVGRENERVISKVGPIWRILGVRPSLPMNGRCIWEFGTFEGEEKAWIPEALNVGRVWIWLWNGGGSHVSRNLRVWEILYCAHFMYTQISPLDRYKGILHIPWFFWFSGTHEWI